ncbi:MAG: hypothetical protein K6U14_10860 [Firmicutes bacterium]|nr:hypothetical protein [Alicyclobacillaceae bacterium]MCL6498112.1 hypothetical protein [Bacillota bacterium]
MLVPVWYPNPEVFPWIQPSALHNPWVLAGFVTSAGLLVALMGFVVGLFAGAPRPATGEPVRASSRREADAGVDAPRRSA